ncbi:hypothetical protein [Microvirga pudoricolor]|uniref:hypothetical protein n=1 Tax=Microvirga pudoricolor TaxID=2778729 RepID=UPI00194F5462|nr:hypothetical protein [Microvirga pudoricolor]MBM6592637.1 hypothetical protein [Microvirga pudoricolor]
MYRIALALAALAILPGPALAETASKTVKAGGRSIIGSFFSYRVNTCQADAVPAAKVRRQGASGRVEIVPIEHTLGKDTPCPGTKVRGLLYAYTPARGFTGADEVAIDVPWAGNDSGMPTVLTYTYRITVQ